MPDTFPFATPNPVSQDPIPSVPYIPPNITDSHMPSTDDIEQLEPSSNSQDIVPIADDVGDPTPTNSTPNVTPDLPRRGTRIRQPPVWMKDYIGYVQIPKNFTLPCDITPPTFPCAISPALSKPYTTYQWLRNLHLTKKRVFIQSG